SLDEIIADRTSGARDILLFQAGEREILETSRWIKRTYGDRLEVLPLYARLPTREQQRIFEPGSRRRVELETNVAENSITVPIIGLVIDPGFARISRYSYRSKLQRLPIESISQASSDQRMGRCGRIAPGTCYRLFDEADFVSRPRYTDPEIKRTNLASVALQMRAFQLGDINTFPFIDPPDPRVVRDADRLLHELGALDQNALTATGRTMARLPVDPRLARMLIEASKLGALAETLIIVSALAIQDPRVRPLDAQQAADQAHREFIDQASDFSSFVNLWQWCENTRTEMTRGAFRRALEKKFISPTRYYEWRELHRQLLVTCKSLKLRIGQAPANYANIHKSILAGSLSFIGMKDERGEYQGPRNMRFRIFPGSTLAARQPKWIVAGEIAETHRTYARGVATVEARWIEDAAPHLIKRSYSEPHWSEKRGEVVAYERAILYGLPIVEKRPVSFGDIEPETCREIFVRDALVRPAKGVDAHFVAHNLKLVRRVLDLQARGRRTDLLVRDEVQSAFYLDRLPADVRSVATLNTWLRHAGDQERATLEMTDADLLTQLDYRATESDYPPEMKIDALTLPIKYRFAPGEIDDGVSVLVDLGALSGLQQDPLDWLVPGFFEQKCVELIRSLPKNTRKKLTPVPDRTQTLLPLLMRSNQYRRGKLLVALAERIEAEFGVRVGAEEWQLDRLSPFLRINIQVRDGRRRIVDQDRDLAALKQRLFERVERQMDGGLKARHERPDLKRFPDDGVPETLTIKDDNGQSVAYPVLEDRGDSVNLTIRSHARGQQTTNRRGYCRLVLLADPKTTRYLKKQIDGDVTMALHYATLGSKADLVDELQRAAVWECFFAAEPLPRTSRDFVQCLQDKRQHWVETLIDLKDAAARVLEKRFGVAQAITALDSPAFAASRVDLEAHLARLVPADFTNRIPLSRFDDIVRYLEGIRYRAENLQGRVQKDLEALREVLQWEDRFEALQQASDDDGQLVDVKFLIEEYRIALFSQRIGTKGKVSKERLQKQFEPLEIRAGLR
ncbi:MAG: ATP-dependent RNA helicase HrpA, partial [Gammaproteobacteria bacterium]|nr:ATP-dependent RNA helicase HrpA [Gammaproteobacteria bacterium]